VLFGRERAMEISEGSVVLFGREDDGVGRLCWLGLAIRQNRTRTVFDRTAVCYADSSISCATLRRGSVWDLTTLRWQRTVV